MHSGNDTEKNALKTNAELTLKLATASLGFLYVLGLLVSNMHLMTLGISDFTSVQARNIMTGCLFVFLLFLCVSGGGNDFHNDLRLRTNHDITNVSAIWQICGISWDNCYRFSRIKRGFLVRRDHIGIYVPLGEAVGGRIYRVCMDVAVHNIGH